MEVMKHNTNKILMAIVDFLGAFTRKKRLSASVPRSKGQSRRRRSLGHTRGRCRYAQRRDEQRRAERGHRREEAESVRRHLRSVLAYLRGGGNHLQVIKRRDDAPHMLYVVIVDFSAAMYVRAMSARHPRRRAAVAPETGVQPLFGLAAG